MPDHRSLAATGLAQRWGWILARLFCCVGARTGHGTRLASCVWGCGVCVVCVGVDWLTLNSFPSLPVLKSAVRTGSILDTVLLVKGGAYIILCCSWLLCDVQIMLFNRGQLTKKSSTHTHQRMELCTHSVRLETFPLNRLSSVDSFLSRALCATSSSWRLQWAQP